MPRNTKTKRKGAAKRKYGNQKRRINSGVSYKITKKIRGYEIVKAEIGDKNHTDCIGKINAISNAGVVGVIDKRPAIAVKSVKIKNAEFCHESTKVTKLNKPVHVPTP